MAGGTPLPNLNTFTVRPVTLVTPGTPVQGPDVVVPHGYSVVVRMRRHAGSPNGYVADSSANAGGTNRSILRDNDAILLNVTNLNAIWVDADTATTVFELIVEQ